METITEALQQVSIQEDSESPLPENILQELVSEMSDHILPDENFFNFEMKSEWKQTLSQVAIQAHEQNRTFNNGQMFYGNIKYLGNGQYATYQIDAFVDEKILEFDCLDESDYLLTQKKPGLYEQYHSEYKHVEDDTFMVHYKSKVAIVAIKKHMYTPNEM